MNIFKSGIIYLSLLNSMTVFSNVTVTTLKMLDGSLIFCNKDSDVLDSRNRNGAYTGKVKRIEIIDNKNLQFNIDLSFLKCAKQGNSVGFNPVTPYSMIEYDYETTQNMQVEGEVLEVRLKGYQENSYKVLFDEKISELTSEQASVPLEFPIDNILTQEQKEQLSNGEKVRGSLVFYISKRINWNVMGDSAKNFINNLNYGKFRVFIELELQDYSLKASVL